MVLPWLGGVHGNPSGAHRVARAARRALDDARDQLAALLGCGPGDLVFSNFSAPGVPEHVSLYVGDGKIIEAQQTGVPVKYSTAPTDDIVVRRVL